MADPWLLVRPGELEVGEKVVLDGEEARHALTALRLQLGAEVVLADGRGGVARAVLTAVGRPKTVAEIVGVNTIPADPGPGVVVALGVLHGQAMDWAVQKAVEIGVHSLVPVVTERVQLPWKAVVGRLGHWQRIARQALKQCRRPWAMAVDGPTKLADLVAARGEAGGVVADPEGDSPDSLSEDAKRFLLVGPEGGLTASERSSLPAECWTRLRLGPHILRADTAAVVGAAFLVALERRENSEFGIQNSDR
jgi:16S rRNA (uracil1498-N3)-methyltransferase